MRRDSRRLLAIVALVVVGCGMVAMAETLQERVISVFQSAAPAVAHITVQGTVEDVFMRPVPVGGSGSGFLYDLHGHIVTNYHVIADADTITVAFGGVDCCPATIVGTDPATDLAVIRVGRSREDLPTPLELADSSESEIGQFVVAIGNPFGLEQTLTFGVVSALERIIQSPDGQFIGEAIQSDAAINPGNSGGPLLDLDGRVIGVTSQIISPSRASAGISFSVPANTVARIVPVLIERGQYPHPSLELVGFDLSPERVQFFREQGVELPHDRGVLVLSVVAGGAAEQAGIRGSDRVIPIGEIEFPAGGDVLVEIGGAPIRSMIDLLLYLESQTQVGDVVELDVLRDGELRRIEVTLAERGSGSQMP